MLKQLFTKKNIQDLSHLGQKPSARLEQSLGLLGLTSLGIGAIIGAGIFVITGQAAAQHAGPAVIISFLLAGTVSGFSALCYAEFASLVPFAGSAYTYSYVVFGEIIAWIIGWDLILEYAFGAATVASGWVGYLVSLLADYGVHLPPKLFTAYGQQMAFYGDRWVAVASLPPEADLSRLPRSVGLVNIGVFVIVMLLTALLITGIRESVVTNSVLVALKVGVVLLFILIGGSYVAHNPVLAISNWHPFLPPNTGNYGVFGVSGVITGAAVVFFAYLGFDAVSTAAQEARRPQRDVPVAIIASLAICTILYVSVSGLLTALVSYKRLGVADPMALGIAVTGHAWGSVIVKVGAILGLMSVMIVQLLAQSRILFAMASDGLLWKPLAAIHPILRTPWIATLATGGLVATLGGLIRIDDLSNLVSIGTLLAFVIVCAGVWVLRLKSPLAQRGFRVPLVPLVPMLGIVSGLVLMASLPRVTWLRFLSWQVIGLIIYFFYGRRSSHVVSGS